MARSDLKPILEAIGLPATIGPWCGDEVVPEEFVEYHMDGNRDKIADNRNYMKVDQWSLNVYGRNTDMTSFYGHCEAAETALEQAGIVYSRSMDLFPGDEMVFVEFTFTLPR